MALWIRVVDRQNAARGQCGAQIIHQQDSREREQHVPLGLGNVVGKTHVPDPPRTVVRMIIDRSKHPRANDALENMARDDRPCAGQVKDPLNAEVRRHPVRDSAAITANGSVGSEANLLNHRMGRPETNPRLMACGGAAPQHSSVHNHNSTAESDALRQASRLKGTMLVSEGKRQIKPPPS